VPRALRDAPGGFALEGSDAAEALRALLAGAGAARIGAAALRRSGDG
jgi:hypothetical protein